MTAIRLPRIWAFLRTIVLISALLLSPMAGTLPLAKANALNKSSTQNDHTIFLPVVMRNLLPSPGDELIIGWAQSIEGATRKVLLQWNPLEESTRLTAMAYGGQYTVFRRLAGVPTWQAIGQARPAASVTEMTTLLGPELTLQLRYDLRPNHTGPPLTEVELFNLFEDPLTAFEDPLTARTLAMQYYEVGLVLGIAYLDTTPPLDQILEYSVEKVGGSIKPYLPVTVPEKSIPLDKPLNVREVWEGPATLGLTPSDRPTNAYERYHWTETQQYRAWDGTNYLIWDLQEQPAGASPDDSIRSFNLRGYLIYRAAPGTSTWTVVNPVKEDCQYTDPEDVLKWCTIMIGASGQPTSTTTGGPGYFFREDLREVYTEPEDIYTPWLYKVCPVDVLHEQGQCSTPVSITARELLPPAPVHEIEVSTTQSPARIYLTWTYSGTAELSPPLRFYVTRNLTFTAPLATWSAVVQPGTTLPYIERPTTNPGTLSIYDPAAMNQPFWYRIQIRDSAGNWSAPGVPVMGALYNRTPPTIPQPPYDQVVCSNNPLPVTLQVGFAGVSHVVVYRAFDASGPWELIQRVPVSQGAATISDDYIPPSPIYAYYQFEAVDDHGNVSAAVNYCAELTTPLPPPPPQVTTHVECQDNTCDLIVTTEDPNNAYQGSDDPIVTIGLPGEQGTEIITTMLRHGVAITVPVNEGAWYTATVTHTPGGPGTTVTGRAVNNFLNANRHLANLGTMQGARWMTDTVSGEHYVEISMAAADGPPPVAAFRRIPGGNWMQITSIERPSAYQLEDHSDPSPTQDYEYVVLAFSPNTYEMLGAWQPLTLEALDGGVVALDDPILPTPTLPLACSYTRFNPSAVGMPETISLHNGWAITVGTYFVSESHDPDCPTDIYSFRPAHAYGEGVLTNGTLTWPLTLYNISVDATTGAHLGGRIVAITNHDVSGPDVLSARFYKVEFLPGSAIADVQIQLPSTIKLHDSAAGERSRYIRGQFEELNTSFEFSVRMLPSTFYWVEENLPWQLHGSQTALSPWAISFDNFVTADRLGYTPPDPEAYLPLPDNNLGYLRVPYTDPTGESAVINAAGFSGDLSTAQRIVYSTGQPAAFIITAANGADIEIRDSVIYGGALKGTSAQLRYYPYAMFREYLAGGKDCLGGLSDGAVYCYSNVGAADVTSLLTVEPDDGTAFAIHEAGKVIEGITVDQFPAWTGFTARTTRASLYVAGAAFSGTPSSWAPLPAENAWRQYSLEVGGDLDPGLSINVEMEQSNYACYSPSLFDDTNMDLYIRRGGVSEFLGIYEGASPAERVNAYEYRERVRIFEAVFVDNGVVPDPALNFRSQLYLPYPTDAAFDLATTEVHPVTNCPASGAIETPTLTLHQYWNFAETPTAYQYNQDLDTYGGAISQRALFGLHGTARINGLHERSTLDPDQMITLNTYTEWLPDGDTGDVLAFQGASSPLAYAQVSGLPFAFTKVELSRYYSDLGNPSSLPSTAGVPMVDNFARLPGALADAQGQLTPQSLKTCATSKRVGCGFVLLDGNTVIPHFGEPQPATEGSTAHTLESPLPFDDLQGQFPIAINQLVSETLQLQAKASNIPWMWPILNSVVELSVTVNLPVKFLGTTEGVVIAAVAKDADLLPDMPLFHGDIGAVITLNWDEGTGFLDKFAVYAGYPASQAAFRALAMNRPDIMGAVLPFDLWEDVQDDVAVWAFEKFGYQEGAGGEDDPVDLAHQLWEEEWCGAWSGDICTSPRAFSEAYDIVVPLLQGQPDGAFGMTDLTSGQALQDAHTNLKGGAAEIIFRVAGNDIGIKSFRGGANIRFDGHELTGQDDVFLEADWIAVELTRDGQLTFSGDTTLQVIDGTSTPGYLQGVATYNAVDAWRVEGGVTFERLVLSSAVGLNVSASFVVGKIAGHDVAFVGLIADVIIFTEIVMIPPIGATALIGTLEKDCPVIRSAGYGEALDYLDDMGDAPRYTGFYARAYGRLPIIMIPCVIEVEGNLTLRLWYFTDGSGESYGGDLSGAVTAEVLCLLSARANLSLGYDRLQYGEERENRLCEDPSCDLYFGNFWVATGIGWCSPSSWDRWQNKGSNWWGDDWCYTFGAFVQLTYLDPPGGWWDGWEFDPAIEFE